MSDRDLFDAVARKTGEDAHEIARRGFVLTGPEYSDSNPEPECLAAARPGGDPVRQHGDAEQLGCAGNQDAHGVPE